MVKKTQSIECKNTTCLAFSQPDGFFPQVDGKFWGLKIYIDWRKHLTYDLLMITFFHQYQY